MPEPQIRIDALLPPEIAQRAEDVGAAKCKLPFATLLVLGILAGAFIALGAVFATTVATGTGWPAGVHRMFIGLSFCLGLILVVVGGAELFTGNNLIAMAWARRRVSTSALLRNWSIVYLGNALGAIGTALIVLVAQQYQMQNGEVGEVALRIASTKVRLGFVEAVALGALCNALVCLAVWLAMGARSLAGKILAILFPISAFVACGFEHSVANMYFVPYGILLDASDPGFAASSGIDVNGLDWGTFVMKNLIPVTIGNIIGGAGLVAAVYWFVYLRTLPPNSGDEV